MNPKTFLGLMSDISDEYIASAANPHSKSIRWYQVSAIAACIVLLIATAIYPKLRMQKPEITEPPVIIAETTAPVTVPTEPTVKTCTATVSAKVQTTEVRTSLTQTQTTAAITVYTTAVTAPEETAVQPTETAPPNTEAPATEPARTDRPAETTVFIQTTVEARTTEPQPVTIPIWKGRSSDSTTSEPLSPIGCQFSLCPPDANNQIRWKYGIPAEFDPAQHQCLLIEIQTEYTRMAIHDGILTIRGLTLTVDCLDQYDQYSENAIIYCSIPIPDDCTIEPENCFVEYLISEDETEFLEKRIKNPTIEIKE